MNNEKKPIKTRDASNKATKGTEKGLTLALELEKLYPGAECALEWDGDPWKLLVMGRLSAQCTDARVNIVCKDLFRVYPTCKDLAGCEIKELENIIKSCGLFHTKAQSLRESANIICGRYDGRVPDTMEALLELPGVGRKIANLVLGDVYNVPGIVADTHCMRICGRLGFYPDGQKDPLKTERIMEKQIPPEYQSKTCHRLVDFGRDVCRAQNPQCDACPEKIREMCKHK